jgi:hypothetical protein
VRLIFALNYILAAAVFVTLIVLSTKTPKGSDADLFLQIGVIGGVMVLVLLPIGLAVCTRKAERTGGGTVHELSGRMDSLAESVRHLTEQSSLSPEARRVLNRRADRDLLFRAIEEDIAAGDWDAGLVLCDELANRFGYRAEAEGVPHADRDDARQGGGPERRRCHRASRRAHRAAAVGPGDAGRGAHPAVVSDSPRVAQLSQRVEHARGVYRADWSAASWSCGA